MRKIFFSLWYTLFKPPWDTGVAPPILEALVGDDSMQPGRALDLGCGTGTNALFLAEHGWRVLGIDFAGPAIRSAQRKQRQAPAEVAARVEFKQGDVARLGWLDEQFDLAFDQGCLHSLPPAFQASYAVELKRFLPAGATYLLWAFAPGAGRPAGLSEAEARSLFAPEFEVQKIEPAESGRAAAWYTFQRR